MRQAATVLTIETRKQGLFEITDEVSGWVRATGIDEGLLTLFCRHTSASLLIQENAAPEVCRDIEAYFSRLAPEDRHAYAHDDEGPDDMPAHLRAALTQVQLSIPVMQGAMMLGTWQGITCSSIAARLIEGQSSCICWPSEDRTERAIAL